MAMMLIIFGSVFVTGLIAFFVSRNVEHGEARFGPDGQLPPYQPQDNDRVAGEGDDQAGQQDR